MYYYFFPTLNEGSAYHYTSIEALRGILSTETFWLSRWDLLNDTDELRYGKEYSLIVLNNLGYSVEYVKNEVFTQNPSLYILSLAVDGYGDKIGHWMMYGKHGDGICLKLNVRKLIEELSKQYNTKSYNPEIFVGNVCYSRQEYTDKLNQIWLELPKRCDLKGEQLIGQFFAHMLCSLPFVKHEEFYIEKELRITITDLIGNQIDNGEKRSIPISKDFIEEIIIGPKISNGNSKDYEFTRLQEEFESIIGRAIVKKSIAPLR